MIPSTKTNTRPPNQWRSINWAKKLVAEHPTLAVLDTETTGKGPDAEIIEIAIVDLEGNVLMDTLLQCQDDINPEAQAKHGISKAMLAAAPVLPDIWHVLEDILISRMIVVYNATFDIPMIAQTAQRYGLALPLTKSQCLMEQYATYHGERRYNGTSFKWQKLEIACQRLNVQTTQAHRALGDAESARQVLLAMAQQG